MKKIGFILIYQCFIFSPILAATKLNVLLNDSGNNPYSDSAPSSVRSAIESAVFGKLLSLQNNMIVPSLLEDAYYDSKSKEYVLTIKKNIYFQNKRQVTIEDLEFSLLRLFFTNEKSFGKAALMNIEGLDEIQKQRLTKFKSGVVSGVKIKNDYTLTIKLITPDPDFLYILTDTAFSIAPMEEFQDNYMDWKSYPIGAGPYSIVPPGFKNGVVELKKHDKSLIKAPDSVKFYTKKIKDIHYDLSFMKLENTKQNRYQKYYSELPDSVFGLTFTNVNPLGNSLDFRKFVQAALDREALQKLASGFSAAFENYPNTNWGIKKLSNPYDPELAQNLFQSLPKNLRDKEWNVSVYNSGSEIKGNKKLFIDEIKRQLGLYGFKMTYFPITEKFLPKKYAEETPFDISFFQIDHFDTLFKFARLLNNGPDQFVKPLYDEKLEALYKNAFNATTKELKLKNIETLSEYVHEKAYWIPLLDAKTVYYYDPNTIDKIGKKGDDLNIFSASNVEMKEGVF